MERCGDVGVKGWPDRLSPDGRRKVTFVILTEGGNLMRKVLIATQLLGMTAGQSSPRLRRGRSSYHSTTERNALRALWRLAKGERLLPRIEPSHGAADTAAERIAVSRSLASV
jgi:tryptophan synthase beta subunit